MTEKYADAIDQATQLAEEARDRALTTLDRTPGPGFTGFCLCCEEQLEPPKRWCDAECRDEWESMQ